MPKAFDAAEFEQRLKKVKHSMSQKGVDAIIVCNPANIDYLTGYNVKSYSNIQAVIVTLKDAMPRWMGRFMDVGGAQMMTYLDADHIHHYVDDFVDSDTKHPFDVVVEILRSQGLEKKRIGVEKTAYFVQPKSVEVLEAGLPEAEILDTTSLVNWVRAVKSPAEIYYMKEAAFLTDLGIQAGFDGMAVGRRENDVAAEILYALTKGTPEIGGFPNNPPMLPTGLEFANTYHTTWCDREYQNNTATGFEFSGARYYYSAPLARTVFLGEPPASFMKAADIMIEGLEALVNGLKAGMTEEEGEQLWRDVAIRKGVDKNARIGYSVGLAYPPAWGENTVSLRPGSDRLLEENMTIHCIPSLMQDDWGLEISETVVIGKDKSEALSKLPRDIVVKR